MNPGGSIRTGPYGVNAYTGRDAMGSEGGWASLAQIERPTQTIYLGENMDGDWVVEPNPAYCPDFALWPAPGWIKETHFNGSNLVFCDGHAKWMRINKIHESNCWLWRLKKP